MRIRVLYFAAVRDLVGVGEEELDVPAAAGTARAFVEWIEQAKPALRGRMASVRLARNEEFAGPDEPLGDGDTVALIPPVAGG